MSTDNNTKFTITDENLEWGQDGPWNSPESPEEPGDVRSETVESSERRRTVTIALEGAAAGGLLVGLVMTLVMLSSSGSSSAAPVTHPEAAADPGASAWVVSPAAKKLAHHTVKRAVTSAIGDARAVAPVPRRHRAVSPPTHHPKASHRAHPRRSTRPPKTHHAKHHTKPARHHSGHRRHHNRSSK
jgi:hypothetical protein